MIFVFIFYVSFCLAFRDFIVIENSFPAVYCFGYYTQYMAHVKNNITPTYF